MRSATKERTVLEVGVCVALLYCEHSYDAAAAAVAATFEKMKSSAVFGKVEGRMKRKQYFVIFFLPLFPTPN